MYRDLIFFICTLFPTSFKACTPLVLLVNANYVTYM